jgi:RNA polymerase sigma factor (sigma-70 family)
MLASTAPRPTDLSVTELVRLATAGDQRAWQEIMIRYGGLVRAVVGSFRLQEADAADTVQNVWVRAWERLDSVREPERLGGWLRTTARRECLSHATAADRTQPDSDLADQLVDPALGPEALALREEACRAVRAAVAGLQGRRRELIDALFYDEDDHYADIAGRLDIPVGSIGPTRARTLRDLRRRLADAGFTNGFDAGFGAGLEAALRGKGSAAPVVRVPAQRGPVDDAPPSSASARMSCVRDRMPSFR